MDTVKVPAASFAPISLEAARVKAPAIFATEPADYITARYKFTNTLDIIDMMATQGWQMTNAKQSKSKDPLRIYHGTHIVEFQHPDLYVKDEVGLVEARPTVLFMNSSDGSRPIQSELGIFRLVCSNGLVIKSHDFGGFRERHSKLDLEAVKQLLSEKVLLMENTISKINQWNDLEMKAIDRKKFATDALILRIGEDRQPDEHELISILEPRRKEDSSNTLWHVFNRVQENLLKGGFDLGNRTARAITNPIMDMTLNQGLWQLAEEYSTVK
jgi:hypothetical protein